MKKRGEGKRDICEGNALGFGWQVFFVSSIRQEEGVVYHVCE